MAQSTLKIQSPLYLRKENRNGKVLLLLFISHRKLQGILCVLNKYKLRRDHSRRAGNDLNREIMTRTLIICPKKISL
jgi:hypothetical protein